MARLALAAAALGLAAGASACARKNDPVPPQGAYVSKAPELQAPGVVTDPIRDLEVGG